MDGTGQRVRALVVDRRSGRGDVFCKFCGDRPGGCPACFEHQKVRAQLAVQRALEAEEQAEAQRCLYALLNRDKEEREPIRIPTDAMIGLVMEAFRWKREQQQEKSCSLPAPSETAREATERRFEAIEWSRAEAREHEERPESPRRIEI